MSGYELRTTVFVLIFLLGGFAVLKSLSKTNGESLSVFQERCEKDNGVVISSTKGLTCIQKEVVLFFEK